MVPLLELWKELQRPFVAQTAGGSLILVLGPPSGGVFQVWSDVGQYTGAAESSRAGHVRMTPRDAYERLNMTSIVYAELMKKLRPDPPEPTPPQ